ncbi:MAG: hypothetical protein ACD_17C00323G0003, partial [uncultured bacterium]
MEEQDYVAILDDVVSSFRSGFSRFARA